MKVVPFGERAALVDLEIPSSPDRASRTRAVAASLRRALGPHVDVVVGAGTVLVAYAGPADAPAVEAAARSAPEESAGATEHARTHDVPVVYDGVDLEAVASASRLSVGEVVARHSRDHIVELLGFLPGFAYLGPVDDALVLPRRPSPRPRVDAGSVALAGGFTGIYPFSSPGGWHLIGRTTFTTFDPTRDEPATFGPGDRVRFVSCGPPDLPPAHEPDRGASAPVSPPAFVVERAPPGCTIQDGGRHCRLGRGLPPSGPLDPDAHAAANLAAGNHPDEAAIEAPLGNLRIVALRELSISIDGGAPITLARDTTFDMPPGKHAVRYLAVAGGIEVPMVLGARATLAVARIGGLSGRPLRAGDAIAVGARSATRAPPARADETAAEAIVQIDAGPHVDRFAPGALERFAAGPWTVSPRSDRVGVRLEGPRVPRDAPDLALPVPMVRGAIQVTTDGTPIALGPDHPTTGGYPVIAVVRPSSFGALARVRPGATVTFRLG